MPYLWFNKGASTSALLRADFAVIMERVGAEHRDPVGRRIKSGKGKLSICCHLLTNPRRILVKAFRFSASVKKTEGSSENC